MNRIWSGGQPGAPLHGVRVVDLGQYLAGPLLATLLADQGADVIRIERPGGPTWTGAANALLHRNRRRIELDLSVERDQARAAALMATADVVIENFRSQVLTRRGLGPQQMLERNPRLVYCSLPGFGLADPRATDPAWEGTIMAAAGGYGADAASSIIPTAEDVVISRPSHLPLASVFAAIDAALGVAAALYARDRDHSGQWLEMPLFDALFEAIGLRGLSLERGHPFYNDFGSGFYHCADGRYVSFVAAFHRHLEWLLAAAGVSNDVGDLASYDRLTSGPDGLPLLRQRLISLFATRSAQAWEELAIDAGFPLGMLRTTGEWMNTAHARQSGTVVDVGDRGEGQLRMPAPAVVVHGYACVNASAPVDDPVIASALDELVGRAGEQTVRSGDGPSLQTESLPPLSGLRVVEQSRIVAAPTAAKLLAQLGAEVIKIDQDPASFRASFPMPFAHIHLDRGKQTITLDLQVARDRAVFDRLLDRADVYIQNFALGADVRLGVDEPTLRARHPALVYLYLNANGRAGPWASGRGYADVANIITGVCAPTISEGVPASGAWGALHAPPWTFTDYAAGVIGAFGVVVALLARNRHRRGALVETSLLRAATLTQLLDVVRPVGADSTVPTAQPRTSAVAETNPLQRVYRTIDGAFFLGAATGQAADVLRALGGDDGDTRDRVGQADLGPRIASAAARLTTADAQRSLIAIGAGAEPIVAVEDVLRAGAHADVIGLRRVDHSSIHGNVVMPGPVIRFSRTPMVAGALPGEFGCDGDRIRASVEPGGAS